MPTCIFRAAGFLNGSKFHKFDASSVGIVEIELPFAAAADLGFFGERCTVFDELGFGGLDVGDAESDVIHDTEKAFIVVFGNIEHEFDPVGAVGDLQRDPIVVVVCPATVPVRAEAEDVFVEVLHGWAVVYDYAYVNDMRRARRACPR